ncbi:MucR family transcriptional regulator [uncultured Brevundimonas sp.]|uniref:MucR family transcriptional regulator n=1 Tax=uncultured Brevundimonas sp. TaxID=213418 RepID=UPI0025F2ADF3|nr:MucR family transcriptional regulator [uncultured Brevundimonas sp.]
MQIYTRYTVNISKTTDILTSLTAAIVAAYVEKNRIETQALPGVILAVHDALRGLGMDSTKAEPEQAKLTTAQVRKSITGAGLVSFINGKTYKSLKRHLADHGITPEGYRDRYGLPADYPMVSPAYAARRSEIAKSFGLGRKPKP